MADITSSQTQVILASGRVARIPRTNKKVFSGIPARDSPSSSLYSPAPCKPHLVAQKRRRASTHSHDDLPGAAAAATDDAATGVEFVAYDAALGMDSFASQLCQLIARDGAVLINLNELGIPMDAFNQACSGVYETLHDAVSRHHVTLPYDSTGEIDKETLLYEACRLGIISRRGFAVRESVSTNAAQIRLHCNPILRELQAKVVQQLGYTPSANGYSLLSEPYVIPRTSALPIYKADGTALPMEDGGSSSDAMMTRRGGTGGAAHHRPGVTSVPVGIWGELVMASCCVQQRARPSVFLPRISGMQTCNCFYPFITHVFLTACGGGANGGGLGVPIGGHCDVDELIAASRPHGRSHSHAGTVISGDRNVHYDCACGGRKKDPAHASCDCRSMREIHRRIHDNVVYPAAAEPGFALLTHPLTPIAWARPASGADVIVTRMDFLSECPRNQLFMDTWCSEAKASGLDQQLMSVALLKPEEQRALGFIRQERKDEPE